MLSFARPFPQSIDSISWDWRLSFYLIRFLWRRRWLYSCRSATTSLTCICSRARARASFPLKKISSVYLPFDILLLLLLLLACTQFPIRLHTSTNHIDHTSKLFTVIVYYRLYLNVNNGYDDDDFMSQYYHHPFLATSPLFLHIILLLHFIPLNFFYYYFDDWHTTDAIPSVMHGKSLKYKRLRKCEERESRKSTTQYTAVWMWTDDVFAGDKQNAKMNEDEVMTVVFWNAAER